MELLPFLKETLKAAGDGKHLPSVLNMRKPVAPKFVEAAAAGAEGMGREEISGGSYFMTLSHGPAISLYG
jgi:hypothetical protein